MGCLLLLGLPVCSLSEVAPVVVPSGAAPPGAELVPAAALRPRGFLLCKDAAAAAGVAGVGAVCSAAAGRFALLFARETFLQSATGPPAAATLAGKIICGPSKSTTQLHGKSVTGCTTSPVTWKQLHQFEAKQLLSNCT